MFFNYTISNYKELNNSEKASLLNIISSIDKNSFQSIEDMDSKYYSSIFDCGTSFFIIFYKNKLVGSMGCITQDISLNEEAFLSDIYIDFKILPKICDKLEVFFALMNKSLHHCKLKNASAIKIGVTEEHTHLTSLILNSGFKKTYDAVIMELYEKAFDHSIINYNDVNIEFKPLTQLNKFEFIDLYNSIFIDSPNAGSIDTYTIDNILNFHENFPDTVGILEYNDEKIGVYELYLDGTIGWIDSVGIISKYQGQQLTPLILNKCIQKLISYGAESFKLLVINTNLRAYETYKKFGFEDKEIFSEWYKRKI